jgi:hypothetical protein
MLSLNQQSVGHEYAKRWKFTMAKDELENAIKGLDEITDILRQIRVLSFTINQQAAQAPSRRSTKTLKLFRKVRITAKALYFALCSAWGLQCNHSHEHLAGILLDDRMHNPRAVKFNVRFEASSNSGHSLHHDSVVEAIEGGDTGSTTIATPAKVKVSFSAPDPAPVLTDIGDICTAICDQQTPEKILKMYIPHQSQRLQYRDETPATSPATASANQLLSLKEVIMSNARISLNERVLIAATVASSVVQLYSTPWIPTLRKDMVLFPAAASSRSTIIPKQAFVRVPFSRSPVGNKSSRKHLDELLDLGILIIELWRNRTLESYSAENEIPLDDTYDSRQRAARHWLNDEEGEFLPVVLDAATRCVECRFQCIRFNFDDESVQKLVLEDVVRPLWENCRR